MAAYLGNIDGLPPKLKGLGRFHITNSILSPDILSLFSDISMIIATHNDPQAFSA